MVTTLMPELSSDVQAFVFCNEAGLRQMDPDQMQ